MSFPRLGKLEYLYTCWPEVFEWHNHAAGEELGPWKGVDGIGRSMLGYHGMLFSTDC